MRTNRHIRQKKRNEFGFLKVVFYLFFVSFLGVIVYVLFFANFLAVSSVEISGNNFIAESSFLEKINPKITGKYFGVIPRNNLLLVNSDRAEKELLERFRLARNIEIKKNFPSSLEVVVAERIPTLILCEKECFLLDEFGKAYDKTENVSEEEKNRYDILTLRDENKKDIVLGQIVLDQSFLEYLQEIRRKISRGVEGEIENDFWTPALISNDIRLKTKEGWGIYLSRNINLEKEVEVLRSVLKEKITSQERADLEYIDLRIENKVYYKFKEGTPSEEARLKAEEALKEAQAPATQSSSEKDKDKKKKD